MRYLIIRTCLRDDYLARLCYESFLLVEKSTTSIIFSCDEGERKDHKDLYKWIMEPTRPVIQFRPFCDNYLGGSGVKNLVNNFRELNQIKDDDQVIFMDSDVVLYEDPFVLFSGKDIAHAGLDGNSYFTKNDEFSLRHISGQLQYFSGKFMRKVANLPPDRVERHIQDLNAKANVADDTFMSYLSSIWNENTAGVPLDHKYWKHHKFYEYEPRTDWKDIVNETLL